ncbi:hypothetical protein [Actinokineospora iranica]|uniref:Uncharacterized protein n=1 Tax=Actinokineospora iranica TaxID=1271860 RepID=A0A1G6WBK9_9PSEU|nr:hypothetical protein [Actinokineospora iranica]SDD62617.1 hypothetical protein SAMN05216174_11483 [Actinokineospora iranica]
MENAARWRAPAVVLGAAAVLPVVLGFALDWADWMTIAVLVLSLALGAMIVKQILFRREQKELRAEAMRQRKQPNAEPPPHAEHHVPAIPVDSAEPYYRFILSCTVCWTPTGGVPQHGNLRGLAVHSILERARHVTVGGSPTDTAAVQTRLAAELGAMLPDRSGQIVAWAEQVALTVPEEDARRLERLTELRKEKQVRHHEQELEQRTRAYLADEVLVDPGTAVVWWLARHPEQVREAADLIPTFARLSAAVTKSEIAPQYAERLDTADRPALSAVNWPRLDGQGDESRRQLPRPDGKDAADQPLWPRGNRDHGDLDDDFDEPEDTSSAR